MLQKILMLVASTVLALLGMSYLGWLVDQLWWLYVNLNSYLNLIFSGHHIGYLFRRSVAVLLIPSLLAGIPTLIYYLITRRRPWDYFFCALMLIWVMTITTVACRS